MESWVDVGTREWQKIADLPKLPGRMSKNPNSERKGKDCI